MRIIACGGRNFDDIDLVEETLERMKREEGLCYIITGFDPYDHRFQGADELAYKWARKVYMPCQTFPADWRRQGRAAGPRRNSAMAGALKVLLGRKLCLAFPGNTGTEDMMAKAAAENILVRKVGW